VPASAQIQPPQRPQRPQLHQPRGWVEFSPPDVHVDINDFRVEIPDFDIDFDWSGYTDRWAKLRHITPRMQKWYQDDPADSLFRAAHALFQRQEYRAGATKFAEVRTRFPNTRYFCDAAYYEAFSRYRLGSQAELRAAHGVLENAGGRCTSGSRRADMPELQARIDGALARQGDAAAAERVRRAANQGDVCDREERAIKTEALSALAQMDGQAADPVLRSVLNLKDECSAPLRRQALALVARRNDAAAVSLLTRSARHDPNAETRGEAVRALGRMNSDAAFAALDELLRTATDEHVQDAAADAMGRSEQPRAQNAIRALIERHDVAERVRLAALSALAAKDLTIDYWRSLYGRVESEALRKAVISAVARSTTEEAQQFLLSVARNPQESQAVRAHAVSRIRGTAPIPELYQLYQNADSRAVRLSIVHGLIARKEPEATDRLIDIAKTSTDVEVRATAIRALGKSPRREDPKVARALSEILACCEP
jgi:HEAT repeat protein